VLLNVAAEFRDCREPKVPSLHWRSSVVRHTRHASNKSLAVLYEYYGRILMYDKADPQLGSLFKRSIAFYPGSENISVRPRRITTRNPTSYLAEESKEFECLQLVL
jgi:hypothetical protein